MNFEKPAANKHEKGPKLPDLSSQINQMSKKERLKQAWNGTTRLLGGVAMGGIFPGIGALMGSGGGPVGMVVGATVLGGFLLPFTEMGVKRAKNGFEMITSSIKGKRLNPAEETVSAWK